MKNEFCGVCNINTEMPQEFQRSRDVLAHWAFYVLKRPWVQPPQQSGERLAGAPTWRVPSGDASPGRPWALEPSEGALGGLSLERAA